MLPILFKLTFEGSSGQALLWILSLALVLYGAWAGYRGAPSREQAPSRALLFAAISAGAVYYGQGYAVKFGAPLHTYGLAIATGFMLAVHLAGKETERTFVGVKRLADGTEIPMGIHMRDVISDLAFWCLAAGLGGARLLFIIVNWDDYRKDLSQIFSLSGGLVFYGAFLGGAGAVYWYVREHKLDFLRLADAIIPAVSIAHAIGRFGCLGAGCCWGGFADPHSHFALQFPGKGGAPFGASSLAFLSQQNDHRLLDESTHKLLSQFQPQLDASGEFLGTWVDKTTGALLHAVPAGAIEVASSVSALGKTLAVYPTQLMESTGELIIFAALVTMRRTKRFHGQILATYAMLYAMLRAFTETFRGDEERGRIFGAIASIPRTAWYNISTSQFVSLCMFLAGAALFARYARQAFGSGDSGSSPQPA